jgi:glyoxylase-like metal-dependent hydrolase (beta-lactamase superfamily II)
MKIIENLFIIPGVLANSYLLVDSDGLTIIDTGLPHSEKKILAYITSLGKSARDVKRIIVTHSDIDHVGSLAALHEATGARTYASRVEAEAITVGESSRETSRTGFSRRRLMLALLPAFMKPRPYQVDEILADGQVLPVLGGLRVVDTSGHSPGHISLFAAAVGVLFCGDSLATGRNGLQGPRTHLMWDDTKAEEALRRQASLGAHIVCAGHGPVVTDATSIFPE